MFIKAIHAGFSIADMFFINSSHANDITLICGPTNIPPDTLHQTVLETSIEYARKLHQLDLKPSQIASEDHVVKPRYSKIF